MAAQCIDCKASASCSCQLTNGRCSACNYKYVMALKSNNNDNTKTK